MVILTKTLNEIVFENEAQFISQLTNITTFFNSSKFPFFLPPPYNPYYFMEYFGIIYGNRKYTSNTTNGTSVELCIKFITAFYNYLGNNSNYIKTIYELFANEISENEYTETTTTTTKEGTITTQNVIGAQTETTDINAYTDTGTNAVTTDNNTTTFNNKDRTTNEHGAQHGSRTQQAHTDTKTETKATIDNNGNVKEDNTNKTAHNPRVVNEKISLLQYRLANVFDKLFVDFLVQYTYI